MYCYQPKSSMYCYQPELYMNTEWTVSASWHYVKAQEAHGEHFVNDECERSDQRVQVNAWWTQCKWMMSAQWK